MLAIRLQDDNINFTPGDFYMSSLNAILDAATRHECRANFAMAYRRRFIKDVY